MVKAVDSYVIQVPTVEGSGEELTRTHLVASGAADPVGKSIQSPDSKGTSAISIVGVVRDAPFLFLEWDRAQQDFWR